jgi:Tol biopolymer transport system component
MGGKNPVNLTRDSLADDTQPSYSPDGVYIAFRSERTPAGIYVMEATSENVRRLSDTGYNPSWSPDGRELVVGGDPSNSPTIRSLIPSPLWIIDVATVTKRQLTPGDAVQPSWSPNGHRIAYWGLHEGGGRRDIWTIPAHGGPPVAVTDDDALDWNPLWSPDGQYLYFASNRGGSMNFWRVLIDERTGETKGTPESVTTPSVYSHHLSFSRDGKRMAYVQRVETQNLHRIAFDPVKNRTTGEKENIIHGTEYVTEPDVSPAGDWLVYSSQGERQEDIYLIKTDGSARRQLTNDPFNDRSPRWSPDGSRIAFYSDRSGRYEIWLINVDGTGLRQATFTSGSSSVYPVWSPDSSHLVFKQRNELPFIIDANKDWDEQTIQQFHPPVAPSENFWPFSWSSDGSRIAGQMSMGGRNSVVIYNNETKAYETIAPGVRPFWARDNRGVFFNYERGIHYADIETKKTREIVSFPGHEVRSACLSPDGRSLYITLRRTEADIWLLSIEPLAKVNQRP